jgi:hypothetical protein
MQYDPARTSLTLASGGMIDLLNPRVEDIDVAVVAEQLAKANRYCGATPGVIYSVARHSVNCAIAALAANESDDVQRYLLLHDWSEHLFGDDTTPKKRALSAIATSFGILSGEIERAFAMLTERADAVIHARLGLAWPAPPSIAERVHYWDRVMLATEWRDLMRCPPPYDFGVTPIGRRITPTLDWRADMQLLRQHVATLFPDAR